MNVRTLRIIVMCVFFCSMFLYRNGIADNSVGTVIEENIEMNGAMEATEREVQDPTVPEGKPEGSEKRSYEMVIDEDVSASVGEAPPTDDLKPVVSEDEYNEGDREELTLDGEMEPVKEEVQKKTEMEGAEVSDNLKDSVVEEQDETVMEVIAGEEKAPSPEFMFIRELVDIQSGHNDANPVWSRDGKLIAFERGTNDKKEIIIANHSGTVIEKVYFQLSNKGEIDFFFPGVVEDISYNSGISWSPAGDRFVFMSNGGGGNYDLYMRELGKDTTTRLTVHEEKDGQAQWSPDGDRIVFVSGREGKGDLYVMDLTSKRDTRITRGEKSYLYPQWSPDGDRIAMIYGSNENHDIYMINDLSKPFESVQSLTTWSHDDLRPVWSPDGKKIAFYSNYNLDNDPKIWSLVVIDADGSVPQEEEPLAAHVVAREVIPDVERGPAWMPDSNRIIYVKNDRHAYNPLYMVNVSDKTDVLLDTGTKMNHDVVCSRDGIIAFRAQVQQWDHIYIAKLKE